MTKIEWTDKVWNPVTGCDAVSPGCDNCYAKVMANRQFHMIKKESVYKNGELVLPKYRNNFKVTVHENVLHKPSTWTGNKLVFVNSMSDLFHHKVSDDFLLKVILSISANPQHIFQILTKRPERALKYLGDSQVNYTGTLTEDDINNNRFVPKNLWLGVSAENQKYADKRIPQLLQIPAAKRFVSCEPLLGEIDLTGDGTEYLPDEYCSPSDPPPRLDWVIIGCESGHNRRPCNLDWVYSLVDQCQNAGVAVFVKQYVENGKIVKKIEDMRPDLQIQEFPV